MAARYQAPVLGIVAQGSAGARAAPLQQLDRDVVGRAHEGHAAVARRAVDRDAVLCIRRWQVA
jgi:hypothetical protein